MRKEGKSISQIARALGRDRSTIHREIRRNSGQRNYRPKQAHRKAKQRQVLKRRAIKMTSTSALDKRRLLLSIHEKGAGSDRRPGPLKITALAELKLSQPKVYQRIEFARPARQSRYPSRRDHRSAPHRVNRGSSGRRWSRTQKVEG